MKLEDLQELLFERDQKIQELKNEQQQDQNTLAEYSARKAYLDEIIEQNKQLLSRKSLF